MDTAKRMEQWVEGYSGFLKQSGIDDPSAALRLINYTQRMKLANQHPEQFKEGYIGIAKQAAATVEKQGGITRPLLKALLLGGGAYGVGSWALNDVFGPAGLMPTSMGERYARGQARESSRLNNLQDYLDYSSMTPQERRARDMRDWMQNLEDMSMKRMAAESLLPKPKTTAPRTDNYFLPSQTGM